jgi:hypothetical protein
MRRLLNEIIFDLKRAHKVPFLFLIQISILCISVNYVYLFHAETIRNEKENIEEDKAEGCYFLMDNLVGEYEEEYLSKPDSLFNLKRFALELENSGMGYVEIYPNPVVVVADDIPETMLYRYEEGDANAMPFETEYGKAYEVKCVFIGENREQKNTLCKDKADVLKDFTKCSDDELPSIILGYGYIDIYKQGDIIEVISPIGGYDRFQVKGFLEKGESMMIRKKYINLDRYVLLPMPDKKAIPVSKDDYSYALAECFFRINGQFLTDKSPEEIQEYINETCNKLGIFPASSVSNAKNAEAAITGTAVETILTIFEEMLGLIVFFSVISSVIFVYLKIRNNIKYYAVLLAYGYSRLELSLLISTSCVIIQAMANVISLLITYLYSELLGMPIMLKPMILVIVNGFIFSAEIVASSIIVKKINVDTILRRLNDHAV